MPVAGRWILMAALCPEGLSFFGPSTLLSAIFRASANACAGRRQRRRAGEPHAVFIVDRDDEPRLPSQVEPVEVV